MDWGQVVAKSRTNGVLRRIARYVDGRIDGSSIGGGSTDVPTRPAVYQVRVGAALAARPAVEVGNRLLRGWERSALRHAVVDDPSGDSVEEVRRVTHLAFSVLLAAFLVLLPFRLQYPTVVNLAAVVVVLSAGAIVAADATVSLTSIQARVLGCLFLLFVWAVAVTGVAAYPLRHLRVVGLLGVLVGFAVAGAHALRTRYERWATLWLLTAVAAAVGLLSLVHVAVELPVGDEILYPRSVGPISFAVPRTLGVDMGYGAYGVLVAIAAAVVVAVFGSRRGVLPSSPNAVWAAGVAATGIAVGAYVGQSRSMLVNLAAVAAVAVAVGLVRTDRSRLRVAVLLVVATSVPVVVPRLVSALVAAGEGSALSRLQQYQLAVDLMLRRPLTGFGWGYFRAVFPAGYQVHNFWLGVGTALGLPGFVLAVAAYAYLWLGCFARAVRADGPAFVAGLLGVLALTGGGVELMLFPGVTDVTAVLVLVAMSALGVDATVDGWQRAADGGEAPA
jgi:O-antigen ligase